MDCKQLNDTCICARVDSFFAQGRQAEEKLMDQKPKVPPTEPDYWFLVPKAIGAAVVAFVIILSSSCGNLNAKDGLKGDTGAQGAVGPQGPAGKAAQACTTQTIPGGLQVVCPDGSSQDVLNGSDGLPGAPGTVIQPVQLCANYVTTYPSSFPEYALCVSGDLYAVYWNGSQAFEAKIVPGYYSSTSPQGCNFTVGPNCQVTQ